MQEVVELVDYATTRLRAGKTPGQVKIEIYTANAGWKPVEVNRAVVAAIMQLHGVEQEQGLQAQSYEEVTVSETTLTQTVGSNAKPALSADADVEDQLAQIENRPSEQGFRADEIIWKASHSWGVLVTIVLGIILLAVIALLLL